MAYTTPITWVNGAVTATSVNEQVRDNVTYLKATFDLITNSTTADSGTLTYIQIRRTASTDAVFEGQVGAEANPRVRVLASGKVSWGAGGASAPDSFLERASAAVMTLSGDTSLRNTWAAAASNSYFTGRYTGDTADRIRLDTDASGNPRVRLGDGTTAGLTDLYHDISSSLGVLDFNYNGGTILSDASNGLLIEATRGGTRYFQLSPGAGLPLLEFGAFATQTYIQRTSSYTLTVGNRAKAVGGFAQYVKAGTIGDGDFSSPAAESGLIGVDTSNGFLAVREGTTWRGLDLRGDMTTLGPYVLTNISTSTTDDLGIGYLNTWVPYDDASTYNTTPQGTARIDAPWGGSIVGISVRSSEVRTAGTATFYGTVNGSTGSLSAQLNGTDTQFDYGRVAAGTDSFTAGQTLGVSVTTSSWTPTTAKFTAFIFVLFTRGDIYS